MCGTFGYVTNKETDLGPILIMAVEILPGLAEPIMSSLRGAGELRVVPWDNPAVKEPR